MASPSYSSTQQTNQQFQRKKKPAPFKFLVPLIYAPVLPLIRVTLRRQPVLRDRLFFGVLAGAVVHGVYLVSDLYDAESK